jgi:hypothetical protein
VSWRRESECEEKERKREREEGREGRKGREVLGGSGKAREAVLRSEGVELMRGNEEGNAREKEASLKEARKQRQKKKRATFVRSDFGSSDTARDGTTLVPLVDGKDSSPHRGSKACSFCSEREDKPPCY